MLRSAATVGLLGLLDAGHGRILSPAEWLVALAKHPIQWLWRIRVALTSMISATTAGETLIES